MKFASTRLIAADIAGMVRFYEVLTGTTADWLAPVFAEIVLTGGVIAIGGTETVALFREGSAQAAANRPAILEFMVSDVDAEFARLKDLVQVVQEPKDTPWGNRAAQFRDPKGSLVSLFTPVTDAARLRFGLR